MEQSLSELVCVCTGEGRVVQGPGFEGPGAQMGLEFRGTGPLEGTIEILGRSKEQCGGLTRFKARVLLGFTGSCLSLRRFDIVRP